MSTVSLHPTACLQESNRLQEHPPNDSSLLFPLLPYTSTLPLLLLLPCLTLTPGVSVLRMVRWTHVSPLGDGQLAQQLLAGHPCRQQL